MGLGVGAAAGSAVAGGCRVAVGEGAGRAGDGVTVDAVASEAFVGAAALTGVGDGFGLAARVGTAVETGVLARGVLASMAAVAVATGDASVVAVETV